MWRFKEKVAISPQKVAILDMKNGGDMWRFLIGEVAISTLNFLATLTLKTNCEIVGKPRKNSKTRRELVNRKIRNSPLKILLQKSFST